MSKCEIDGKTVYQSAPCPSNAVTKSIEGGAFSVTQSSEAAKQAGLNADQMEQERLQREQEYQDARNNQAIQDQQQQQQAYRQQLINRANAPLDPNASIGEMIQQKADRENAQRALGVRTSEDDQNDKIKRLERQQMIMESERYWRKY